MNEFILEKLGEVLAFARVGKDTLAKGETALRKVVNDKKIAKMVKELDNIERSVIAFALDKDGLGAVETKAEESSATLTDMRNTYVKNKWDENSEVLEWMGFYTGASLVHWYLLSGAGKKLKQAELKKISTHAIDFYTSLFVTDEKLLAKIGAATVS
jgi:hypothetical protein